MNTSSSVSAVAAHEKMGGLFGAGFANRFKSTQKDLLHQNSALAKQVQQGLQSVNKALQSKGGVTGRDMFASYVQQSVRSNSLWTTSSNVQTTKQATPTGYKMSEILKVQDKGLFSIDSNTKSVTNHQLEINKKGQGAGKGSFLNQTTEFQQQRNVVGNTQADLNRLTNTTVDRQVSKDGNKTIAQTHIASAAAQTYNKQTDLAINTDTVRTVTNRDANGNVIGQNFLHRGVEEAISTNVNQTAASTVDRNILQETSVQQLQVGGYKGTRVEINTDETRQGASTVATATQTDYAATIRNFNAEGDVTAERNVHSITDARQLQNTNTAENIQTNREVTNLTNGKQTINVEHLQQSDVRAQTTEVTGATTTSQLNAAGDVVAQRTTGVEASSELNSTLNTDYNRATIRDANGVKSIATLQQEGSTNVVTNVETTDAAGRVTQRQVERDITTERNLATAGEINVKNLDDGGKAFNLSTVEMDRRATTDVTREGNNQVTRETEITAGKVVNGNIDYTPAQEAAGAANGPKININFGTYSGLASGFQLDSGEVHFNLEFSGAAMTGQTVTRERIAGGETAVVGQNETVSGQLDKATLSGTLRATVNEDGTRTYEVLASYRRAGAKFVSEGGDSSGAARSTGETELEIAGRVQVSNEGGTRNVESNFDVNRVSKTEAEGTSATAVKQALAQNDPLRNAFQLDRGTFRFQLGFANLNIAIYA
ncbi:MAG: hypothetical protein HY360_02745 [Verrucomicrobia bacterium]|nr:hypothetical protein [Verrucomicrobiota bacterium]